ncbi:hypothetical protein QUF79_04465 [Fictibacillus enclensis]|uniref:hypothetical protein n=1 Tax=Fictibacillus enclensis TaxID=1017270 RepID=UPI0025A0DFF6|nr:hypothetical protein [Fictibacillus enclensis]MDM5197283.1 hypothetical protein [Fictibacillus enclensis]
MAQKLNEFTAGRGVDLALKRRAARKPFREQSLLSEKVEETAEAFEKAIHDKTNIHSRL